VTLGADGVIVVRDGEVIRVASPRVEPVDTTGAGDAFCGTMGEALSRGANLSDAVHWAAKAGALATTRHGAQAAMPTREELERFS
jgi:ribokinase